MGKSSNTETKERSKLDYAVIKALVAQGVTTHGIIAPLVTCNKGTISRHLKTIADELTDTANKSVLFDPFATSTVDLLKSHSKQLKMLQKQAQDMTEALELHETGDSKYLAIQRQILATNNELNKLSGLQCALDISKAAKIKQLDNEPQQDNRPIKQVGYTPATLKPVPQSK